MQEFRMAAKAPEFTDRKPRADALRNRERILEVAKEEFTGQPRARAWRGLPEEQVSVQELLYRHFPTREELLLAVYRSEMEKLAAAERTFADTGLLRLGQDDSPVS